MAVKFWKAVFWAWIAASIVLFFGNVFLVDLADRAVSIYGAVFTYYETGVTQLLVGRILSHFLENGKILARDTLNIIVYFLTILIATYIMAELRKPLHKSKNIKPSKHGALVGLLFSLPIIVQYYFYAKFSLLFPPVLVSAVLVNIAAFIAAAFVYSKLDR